MTWILLTPVQEISSGFGFYFTFMRGFGTMPMWSNDIWDSSLLPIKKIDKFSSNQGMDTSFSQTDSLELYFTKVGCGRYATG